MNFAAGEHFDTVSANKSVSQCATCSVTACGFRQNCQEQMALRFHDLKRGDSLECSAGACLRFWNIVDGYAATSTLFRDGRRQILSIEHEGDTVCGSMAATDSEQRLEALTPCRVCEVDFSHLAKQLLSDPAFLAMTARMIHDRLEKTMAHAAVLGRLDSRERVTYYLAEMAFLQGKGESVTTLPMSREDIADYLGLNADSVSRVLTSIRKSGLFRFLSATEYTVPDMKAVARRLPVSLPTVSDPMHFGGGTSP